MRLLLTLCLLLQLLSVHAPRPSDLAQAKYCQFLGGRRYKQLCVGRYTQSMKIRYLDNKVVPKTPFSVYQAEDKDSEYIASLRTSEMHSCHLMENVNYTNFNCKDPNNEHSITLLRAGMFCFDYQVEYVDDLVELCLAQHGKHDKVPKSTKVAILYTYRTTLDDHGRATSVAPFNGLLVALLSVLPLRL